MSGVRARVLGRGVGGGVCGSLLVLLGLVLLGVLLVVGVGSAYASTPECPSCRPWWGITTGSRASSLRPGVGRSEVQEITAEKGGASLVGKGLVSGLSSLERKSGRSSRNRWTPN